MNDTIKRFTSRKFLLVVFYVSVIFVNRAFDIGLTEEELINILYAVLTFLGVEGVADIRERGNKFIETVSSPKTKLEEDSELPILEDFYKN